MIFFTLFEEKGEKKRMVLSSCLSHSHSHFYCVAFESVAETGTVGVVLVGTQNSRKEKNAMHDKPAWPSIAHVVCHVDRLTAPIGSGLS